MAHVTLPANPAPEKSLFTAEPTQKTCPRCGKPLHVEYTCGCPERWENEGGVPTPDDQGPSEMRKA